MLRFDIKPVDSNAYRFIALLSFLVALIYLTTPYAWVSVVLMLGGFLRGMVSPHRCPSYLIAERISVRFFPVKRVNAGSKMFADKIAMIAGTAMFVTWLLGSSIGQIPAYAILIFSFLDLTTGFCAACWAYMFWHEFKKKTDGQG